MTNGEALAKKSGLLGLLFLAMTGILLWVNFSYPSDSMVAVFTFFGSAATAAFATVSFGAVFVRWLYRERKQ